MKNSVFTRHYKTIVMVLCCVFLVACGSTTTKSDAKAQAPTNVIHQDSTQYFAERTGSISMRATFLNTSSSTKQPFVEGYKFQFRSIQQRNVPVSQVSIIAGGQKFELAENAFFVPPNQGINLALSIEESKMISQQSDAILRFKANNQSYIMSISQHQLIPFIVQ